MRNIGRPKSLLASFWRRVDGAPGCWGVAGVDIVGFGVVGLMRGFVI